jgi:hypothetical protein
MVSGPASSPVATSFWRISTINVTTSAAIAVGLVWGRRVRGSKTVSPSTR